MSDRPGRESDDPSQEKIFARKSWKVWFLVTGGMVIMGAINLAIGFSLWPDEDLEDPMSNRPPPVISDPGYEDAGADEDGAGENEDALGGDFEGPPTLTPDH